VIRRRGIVMLTQEDLWRLLALGPDEWVSGVLPDPIRDAILIRIEGPTLPEVDAGLVPPYVERPFAMAELRLRLLEIFGERRPGGRLDGKPEEFADEVEALIRQAVLPCD
jgi:hypothetical protein